jgi:hypothetical protein
VLHLNGYVYACVSVHVMSCAPFRCIHISHMHSYVRVHIFCLTVGVLNGSEAGEQQRETYTTKDKDDLINNFRNMCRSYTYTSMYTKQFMYIHMQIQIHTYIYICIRFIYTHI